MQREVHIARKDAAVPPRPKHHRHGGQQARHPANRGRESNVSLLRLSVPARILIGASAAAIVWLSIGWALA